MPKKPHPKAFLGTGVFLCLIAASLLSLVTLSVRAAHLIPQNAHTTAWSGTGNMKEHPKTPQFAYLTAISISLGDLDGDGDLDAILGTDNHQSDSVWRNDGRGNFTPHSKPDIPDTGDTFEIALGDLDGDGDLDAVFANHSERDSVWMNDGTGIFSLHPTPAGFDPYGGDSTGIDLGDLDGDGDLDAVVVANALGLSNRVYLNDSRGNFSPHPEVPSLPSDWSYDAELGDLDGDGDLDLVISNQGFWELAPQTVWLNDGVGNFYPHPTRPEFGAGDSREARLGDFDGDGDLDAIVINGDQQAATWLNNGSGEFTPHPLTPAFGSGGISTATIGDIDADCDLDVILLIPVSGPGLANVWLNQNQADVEVVKALVPAGRIYPGKTITYTLTIHNNGPQAASYIQIRDHIHSVLKATTYTSSLTTALIPGTRYSWEVDVLQPGESGTLTITGMVDRDLKVGLNFTNSAFVEGFFLDPQMENNLSQVTSEVIIISNHLFLPVSINK